MLDHLENDSRSALDLCGSRRQLFRGLAAIGVTTIGAGILTACGGDDGASTATPSAAGSSSAAGGSSGGSAASGVPTSEVPVGEARVVDLAGQRVVIAQPTEGEFVAFSARCTHQGTEVEPADGLTLRCPNHGSQFDAGASDAATAGAAVLNGPAAQPLPAIAVQVQGDQIVPA